MTLIHQIAHSARRVEAFATGLCLSLVAASILMAIEALFS